MWLSLFSVALSRNWQFSPPVEGTKFRLRYDYPLGWFPRGVVAQCSTSSPPEMTDCRRFFGKLSQHDMFEFVQPREFEQRAIAIKGTRYPEIISVAVDYWDASNELPSNYSIGYSNLPIALAVSNPRRRELTLRNASDRALYVGLGASVSLTDYFAVLPPGALFGFPESWKGQISGLWEPGGSGEAIIKEFL